MANNNFLFNMLLGKLRNQNPNAYNEVQSLMNSGKNPEQVLNDLLASGRFTEAQVQQARATLNQYSNQDR